MYSISLDQEILLVMNTEKKGSKLAIGFIVVAAVVGLVIRLMPHVPNFTPMESLLLFSGAYLGRRFFAFLIPLAIWYFSDLIINNTVSRIWYPDIDGMVWFTNDTLWVYLAAIVMIFGGSKLLKKWNPGKLALTALGASVLFFMITNFGTWMSGILYPKTGAGLASCFTAAIPFLKNSLLSNLAYTAILFGGYEWAHKYFYTTNANIEVA